MRCAAGAGAATQARCRRRPHLCWRVGARPATLAQEGPLSARLGLCPLALQRQRPCRGLCPCPSANLVPQGHASHSEPPALTLSELSQALTCASAVVPNLIVVGVGRRRSGDWQAVCMSRSPLASRRFFFPTFRRTQLLSLHAPSVSSTASSLLHQHYTTSGRLRAASSEPPAAALHLISTLPAPFPDRPASIWVRC